MHLMPISNYLLNINTVAIPAILAQKLAELSSFVQGDSGKCLNQALQQVGNVDGHVMLSVTIAIKSISTRTAFQQGHISKLLAQSTYLIKL